MRSATAWVAAIDEPSGSSRFTRISGRRDAGKNSCFTRPSPHTETAKSAAVAVSTRRLCVRNTPSTRRNHW